MERGDFALAARNLEQYLDEAPAGIDLDRAMYHLGLIYALPGFPQHDWTRAKSLFTQLVTEFPQSPWIPAARIILSLREDVVRLTADAERRDARIKELSAEGEQRAQRIRDLSKELDRLIQIDAERRPRP
jgi:hypothetical protein